MSTRLSCLAITQLITATYLDQTALHVARVCSLDGSVHQTLTASHGVEEEFCWCQACVEAVLYKATGFWVLG